MLTNQKLSQVARAISLLQSGTRVTVPMPVYLENNPKFICDRTIVTTAIIDENRVLYMGGQLPPVKQQYCRLYS
ncbi:hypothetical protein [Chamaesiphon sp.]|uniref:hypothetical protein n=1 Tax=Chamaesiphon sp. TaxID=2814140 RepID=UPI00359395E9